VGGPGCREPNVVPRRARRALRARARDGERGGGRVVEVERETHVRRAVAVDLYGHGLARRQAFPPRLPDRPSATGVHTVVGGIAERCRSISRELGNRVGMVGGDRSGERRVAR